MSEEEAVTVTHQRSVDQRFDVIEQQFQFIVSVLKELIEKVDSIESTTFERFTAESSLRDEIAATAFDDVMTLAEKTWEDRARSAYEAADAFLEARKVSR